VNWTVVASIAELIGAVGVIVSLIYLSIQIRSNTRATKSGAYQMTIQSEMDLASVFIEHADVWDKVLTGSPLAGGAETRTGILLYNMLMLDTARRYQQYAFGYLEAQAWDARRETLPTVVALPIFREWRNSLGARGHSADFLRILDECVPDSAEASAGDSQ
jgi:hypothetical protein